MSETPCCRVFFEGHPLNSGGDSSPQGVTWEVRPPLFVFFLCDFSDLEVRNVNPFLRPGTAGKKRGSSFPRGHATARFLEGLLEGSLKEALLRRVLRRHLVKVSVETEVLRRVLRGGGLSEKALRGCLEGRNMPFRRARPPLRAP